MNFFVLKRCFSPSVTCCVTGHQGGDRAGGPWHGPGHADGITERHTARHAVQVKTCITCSVNHAVYSSTCLCVIMLCFILTRFMCVLSRPVCGIRGKTLIINLPGSKKGSQVRMHSTCSVVCWNILIPTWVMRLSGKTWGHTSSYKHLIPFIQLLWPRCEQSAA